MRGIMIAQARAVVTAQARVVMIAIIMVLAVSASAQSGGGELRRLSSFRIQLDDDSSFAEADFDDSAWPEIRFASIGEHGSPFWLRTEVVLPVTADRSDGTSGHRPLGFHISAMASHEVWWDGEPLARGGVVGSSPATEIPGPLTAVYALPDRLAAPGRHVLALRFSAHHRHFEPSVGYWQVLIGDYATLLTIGARHARIALIALSALVAMSIFALALYAYDRPDRSHLFLGLLCATAALLLVVEAWRPLVGYTYDLHVVRLRLLTGLAIVFDLLLLVFLTRRFPMSGTRLFLSAGLALAVIPAVVAPAYDPKVLFGLFGAFALACLWCLRALAQRRIGALAATIGVGACFLSLWWEPRSFLDRDLYLASNVLVICLLVAHVQSVRHLRAEREAARTRALRLEAELLRRQLTPHFMMNTLTSLSEWIEEAPATANEMVHALADELRMLAVIADRTCITLGEELDLCRRHLRVMSLRKGLELTLETDGVDPGQPVPPAVLHTVLENAITHNGYHEGPVTLRLTARDLESGRRQLIFDAPIGDVETDDPAEVDATPSEGTGLRYVRARLRETFGDDWRLTSGPCDDAWRTTFTLPRKATTCA